MVGVEGKEVGAVLEDTTEEVKWKDGDEQASRERGTDAWWREVGQRLKARVGPSAHRRDRSQ